MKRIIQTDETDTLTGLLGKRVTFFCARYIYWGELVGVNDFNVELSDVYIVYETGPFTEPAWTDAQKVADTYHIARQAIESFGVLAKTVAA